MTEAETLALSQTRTPRAGTPRLGFAGVGWIGRSRLEAVALSGLAEIAAISDPSPEALAKAAEHAPEAVRCPGFDELLSLDLDGVVIATPSALHAQQCVAALERGRAVFCQKPLARTGDETLDVINAARSADRLLGVDLSYRHTTALQAVRELVQSGALGDLYAVEAVFHNAYGPDKTWFYDAALAGGGCLLDLGIHLVDAVLWCLGFPGVEASAGVLTSRGRPWGLSNPGVEDYAAGLLQLSTGAPVQLACSWKLAAGCDARIEISFYGTEGGASFRNLNGSFYEFIAEHFLPDRSRRVLVQPPDAWGGRAAVDWARRLTISRAFDPEIEHLVTVARTLDRLYGRAP
ncbi:oxidoreductase [Opitutaceae bacterium EW11]|nr:oxidoreductase [Opitutaceae bacterium EW11]